MASLVIASAIASAPARAVDTPVPGVRDSRVRTVAYDPTNVVRVIGAFRTSTQILFGPDEEIVNVALGDSIAWEVAPSGNILFLKPRENHPPTNLQVVTTKPGDKGTERRSYQFELSIKTDVTADDLSTFFAIRFSYPGDTAAAQARRYQEARQEHERKAANDTLATAAWEGPRNWKYLARGSRAVEPSEISDNGKLTVLRFPENMPIPAIYAVSAAGSETVVPRTVQGELVILHAVAAELRIRNGREVLSIINTAYDGRGVNPGTGTVSPAVVRTTR